MREFFEMAWGSVRGREHERLGLNSQDAFAAAAGEEYLIGIVADGCGSGEHSEVGAKLGAQIVLAALQTELSKHPGRPARELLDEVEKICLRRIGVVSRLLAGDLHAVLGSYFLFTVLGFVVTPRRSFVFAQGDGVWSVNGETAVLDYQNQPPYLAYGLARDRIPEELRRELGFKLLAEVNSGELDSLLVATDGFAGLLQPLEDDERAEAARALSRPWEDKLFFRNPFYGTRQLRLLNREQTNIDWEKKLVTSAKPLLADDATFVALRRTAPRLAFVI